MLSGILKDYEMTLTGAINGWMKKRIEKCFLCNNGYETGKEYFGLFVLTNEVNMEILNPECIFDACLIWSRF